MLPHSQFGLICLLSTLVVAGCQPRSVKPDTMALPPISAEEDTQTPASKPAKYILISELEARFGAKAGTLKIDKDAVLPMGIHGVVSVRGVRYAKPSQYGIDQDCGVMIQGPDGKIEYLKTIGTDIWEASDCIELEALTSGNHNGKWTIDLLYRVFVHPRSAGSISLSLMRDETAQRWAVADELTEDFDDDR